MNYITYQVMNSSNVSQTRQRPALDALVVKLTGLNDDLESKIEYARSRSPSLCSSRSASGCSTPRVPVDISTVDYQV